MSRGFVRILSLVALIALLGSCVVLITPTVRITFPQNGEVFTDPHVTVEGYVEDFDGTSVTLYLNGISRIVPLESDGSFSYTLVLESGENHIKVVATNEYGVSGSDEIVVYYQGEEEALWIELTWDQDKADVDLYVYEPDGKVVWYDNKVGNGELDYDDTDGYGPEHYTLLSENAINGTYRIRVHYYDSHGQESPVTCRVVVKKFGSIVMDKTYTLSVDNSYNNQPDDTGPDWWDVGEVTIP